MSVRSSSVLGGASRRSAENDDLLYLFAEIRSARVADRRARGMRQDGTPRSDAARLTSSLRAYARALEQYRLPVPPVIRDELRLRGSLR